MLSFKADFFRYGLKGLPEQGARFGCSWGRIGLFINCSDVKIKFGKNECRSNLK